MTSPTYSLQEIERMIDHLGEFELSILFQLIEEEKEMYSAGDVEGIYCFLLSRLEELKVAHLVKHSRY